jgi:transposase-like protein
VKRRARPILWFKSMASARAILSGVEMIHMLRKGKPSLAEQFNLLAA